MRELLGLNRLRRRVLLAAVVAALAFVPFTPFRLIAFFLAAGVLPGIAIAAPSRLRTVDSVGLGTAVSPIVFGVCVLVALWMGATAHFAAMVAMAASLALFVVMFRAEASAERDETARRALVGVAILIVVAAVMSFSLPLAKLWWRARDDSWFHAAVTNKLLRDGLPLTDPYFAGLRLQYMYFYHAVLAACVSLVRVDAMHAMIVVNALALVSCASAFHALAGIFSQRVGPRVAATALCLFGMNGWFYFFWVIRLARGLGGATHGTAVLHRLFSWSPNGHATAMSLIAVEGNQFMFLDKFMIGTAFSLTFSLAASMLYLLLGARRGAWSPRHDVILFLCTAGAMLLHPMTGITLAAITAVELALLLLVRSQTERGGPSYARLLAWLAAGVLVTIPYVRSVAPAGGGEAVATLSFQPGHALGLLADILPALVFTVIFLRHAGEDADTPERLGARPFAGLTLSGTGILVTWFLLMLAVALSVNLTTNNETKFSFFLWIPLCAMATGIFDRAWDMAAHRRIALAMIASATLPLHMLYFHHAVRDRSTLTVSDQEKAVYHWIEKSTPHDAVFIEAADNVRVPVLADRDTYWGTEAYAHNWGYPADEMSARRALRDHVFSREGIGDGDVERLRALGRRVFVIYRTKETDSYVPGARFQRVPRLRGKFVTDELAVWEVMME